MTSDTPRVLGPRLYRALQVVWWLMLPCALAAVVLSTAEHVSGLASDRRGFPAAGVQLIEAEPPMLEPFGPAAVAAGLRPESVLLAVDGRSVETVAQARAAAAAVPDGRLLTFRVFDADGRTADFALPRQEAQLDAFRARTGVRYAAYQWIVMLMERVVDALWIGASVLLFRTRGREAVPLVLSIGALGLVAATFWDSAGERWSELFYVAGAVATPSLFWVTAWALTAFPKGRLDRRWQVWALAAIGLGALGLAAAELADGPWEAVALLLLLATFPIAAAAVGGRWRRMPDGIAKQQIKWAAGGLAFGSVLLISGVALIGGEAAGEPPFGVAIWLETGGLALSFAGVSAIIGGLLIALLRFRLFDAEAVIGRSTALGAMAVMALAIWAAVEKFMQGLLAETLGLDSGPTMAALIATLGALVVIPTRKRLSRLTERRFQPSVAALRTEVPERLRDLKDTAEPREIAEAVSREVARAVRSVRAALISDAGEVVEAAVDCSSEQVCEWATAHMESRTNELTVNAQDPVFAVSLALPAGAGLAARRWLLLGPRPDGSPPSVDDLKAVRALAVPLGRAMEAAADRVERDARLAAQIEALREELHALAARLATEPQRPA